MRKIGLFLMVFTTLFIIVGCNTAESTSQESNQNNSTEPVNTSEGNNGTIKLGALWPSAEIPPVQSKMEAAEEMAKELGVELINMDAQLDAHTQSEQAKNLIAQKVDGVLIDLIDPQAIVPAIKELHEAGIPVITTTMPVAPEGEDYVTAHIGTDTFNNGRLSAELIIEVLGDEGGKVVVVEGAPGVYVSDIRAGFEQNLAKATNIELLDSQSSPWDRQKAMDIMQDFLTKYPDLDAVFVYHDNMVPGVNQALRQVEKEGQVKIIGWGATIEGVELIEQGIMYGSVVEDLWWQSQEGVRQIVDYINGNDIPEETLGDIKMITIDDLGNYTSKNY